ncbi:MAG: hypothetical protein U0T33_12335 [Bacteroidales bacterium]
MKKKLIIAAAFVIFAVSFNACSLLQNCKTCKYVTYDNGSYVSETGAAEYCGTDLVKQEAIPDVTVGSVTTKVECN